jgi:ribonucleoside-diphosphate reductase beta chain
MSEDVKDYKEKLTEKEKQLLTKILRFFVQGDIDIGSGYHEHYIPMFNHPEIKMMLSGFAAREALHVAAYAHLIETLGLPESTYNEFLEY